MRARNNLHTHTGGECVVSSPLLYFGEPFLYEVVLAQQLTVARRTQDIVDIEAMYPISDVIFRQHVGYYCTTQDVYFDYDNSNDLIDALANAEFDHYKTDISPEDIMYVLDHLQCMYRIGNQVRNPSEVSVW